jgi:hypothetical protein
MRIRYTSVGLLAVALALPVWSSAATMLSDEPNIELVPHQAVYNMTLHNAAPGSNVADVRGRMVLSLRGSPCAGYTITQRLVTRVTDLDGKSALTDMRSLTQEQDGRFHFGNTQYLDRRLRSEVVGLAAHQSNNATEVTINKPKKRKLKLEGQPLFPTQHSLAILQAAKAGRNVMQANVYDGSDSGNALLETATVIGKPLAPGTGQGLSPVENGGSLDDIVSWPVSIGYFDKRKSAKADEGLPKYEISYRLYSNGVTRNLLIDYGNFSITGELNHIEFFEPTKCSAPKIRHK